MLCYGFFWQCKRYNKKPRFLDFGFCQCKWDYCPLFYYSSMEISLIFYCWVLSSHSQQTEFDKLRYIFTCSYLKVLLFKLQTFTLWKACLTILYYTLYMYQIMVCKLIAFISSAFKDCLNLSNTAKMLSLKYIYRCLNALKSHNILMDLNEFSPIFWKLRILTPNIRKQTHTSLKSL